MTETTLRPSLMPTLAQTATNGVLSSAVARNIVLATLGTILLTISAKISIPFFPVPMTMQTFVVLTLGMAFGWRLGAATVLFYLAQGAVGLPVFAGTPEKGIGIAYMMGTTGGYLLGFVFAAAAVGYLAERGWDRSFLLTALAQFIGTVILFVPGLLWLGTVVGWDKPVLEWGLYPFIYGAILKAALATALMPMLWKLLHRFKG